MGLTGPKKRTRGVGPVAVGRRRPEEKKRQKQGGITPAKNGYNFEGIKRGQLQDRGEGKRFQGMGGTVD